MRHMNNYQKLLLSTLPLLIAFLGLPSFALAAENCASLTRNLGVGASGQDVKQLQQLLNANPATRVSETGIGSRGQETTYFGTKTKLAVIKFQNLFKAEVLTPAGLAGGTGYVGLYSRAKLLALCIAAYSKAPSLSPVTPVAEPVLPPIPAQSSTSVQSGAPPIDFGVTTFTSPTPLIMYPSSYAAPRGTKITLYALGLATTGNTVHLGSSVIEKTLVDSWGMLTFTIPPDAPRGIQNLFVSSSKGNTNSSFLIVTDPAVSSPKILTFSPKEGPLGSVVTVTGEGFTFTGNEAVGGQGVQSPIASSDGKTIQFTVNATIPGLNFTANDLPSSMRVPIWFYLRNENGLTESIIFTVTR